ncbi:MAG: beta-propeller domain-containing protein [Myxococcales bacterium]|nr:beta-propeller domain-containing protein [Myxococcales bacterium]MCB9718875.1 beta-propeller domain-containing protein [Myxococcales bacterium]
MTISPPIRPLALAALALATLATATAVSGCKKASPSLRAMAPESGQDAAAAPADESITNTQEVGVDEGGIVKTHGDHLVVLRRGRLFTVHLGRDALRPISYVDVTPHPSHDAWYDEMLVHGDTVVVIGFSYRVRATEVGLFRIDDEGHLSYVDTYFLDSNDYYSSSNYASRLVGSTLVFYMPHYAGDPSADDEASMRVGRWRGGDRRTRKHGDWQRMMDDAKLVPPIGDDTSTVHSVVTCDLGAERLGCRARGIRGGYGRSFYVSADAVYVWTQSEGDLVYDDEGMIVDVEITDSALYRLPLREGPIGAVHVRGMPVDQFSFHESEDHLNVLVRQRAVGDAMWGPERSEGRPHLLRLPLADLQQRGETVPDAAYRALPETGGEGWAFHNRFVGGALLYGEGNGWGYNEPTEHNRLYVHHYADAGGRTDELSLPHGIDRLEALGEHGLVVGSDGDDLHLSSLRLDDARASVAARFVLTGASQGELRSHGFFFKPSGPQDGVLGLPVRHWNAPGYEHLFMGSAGVLYLGVDDLRLRELGELTTNPLAGQHDACQVSCMDWYGNARPIFYRGRVFALLGYELVEGEVVGDHVVERRRVDMSRMIGGSTLRHAG